MWTLQYGIFLCLKLDLNWVFETIFAILAVSTTDNFLRAGGGMHPPHPPSGFATEFDPKFQVGSPLRAFQSGIWTSYVFPKPPKRGDSKRKVSKICTISCDNSETVWDRMPVRLLLITNRKWHAGFRLIPTSMTLNGVIALLLRFFIEFDCLAGQLRHSGWRPVKYCLPVKSSTFGHN